MSGVDVVFDFHSGFYLVADLNFCFLEFFSGTPSEKIGLVIYFVVSFGCFKNEKIVGRVNGKNPSGNCLGFGFGKNGGTSCKKQGKSQKKSENEKRLRKTIPPALAPCSLPLASFSLLLVPCSSSKVQGTRYKVQELVIRGKEKGTRVCKN